MRKFMRPRPAPAAPAGDLPPHETNGIANGGSGARRDDQHSSLTSRYWSELEGSGGSGGALWEDPQFPAAGASLGDRRLARRTLWLRPHELCSRPRFLGDAIAERLGEVDTDAEDAGGAARRGDGDSGTDGGDVDEDEDEESRAARWRGGEGAGPAADEHVARAAAALALTPRLLARVAPPQSFRHRYTGRFRFRLWVWGAWREVFVDDRLPARAPCGPCGAPRAPPSPPALLAARPAHDDFTLPLLEKAYAKLHGSYAALRGGSTARALQELTGAVLQSYCPPRQPRAALRQLLLAAVPRATLLLAVPAPAPAGKGPGPPRPANGLLPGEAYCVTGLASVRAAAEGEGDTLVRVRAAGGRGEWAGGWARGGPQWRALPPPDRELLARRAAAPGHFWMSLAEFARAFSRLELAHVGPDDWVRERALHARRPWRAVLARRRWRRGHSAGGPPHAPTAHANPRFHLQVRARTHVVVSVTQQYRPGARERLHGIGFAMYELPAAPAAVPLSHADCTRLRALDVTHWSRAREVAAFFTLPPGQYLLVPHTRRAHTDAAFLLRVLTDDHADVWEVNDDNVIFRDIAAEFMDQGYSLPSDVQAAIHKTLGKEDDEVDAARLLALLRRVWRRVLPARPSLELCRALLALRDPGVRGAVRARDLPPLLAQLAAWRAALPARPRPLPAYRLRALLLACGVRASNKVLECVVLRFARGVTLAPLDALTALARLHLAHERYRILDTKVKSNPLSLEEMILMTIYS